MRPRFPFLLAVRRACPAVAALVLLILATGFAPAATEPGATVQAFELGEAVAQVPTLAPDQTPNVDAVVPVLSEEAMGEALADVAWPALVRVRAQVEIPTDGRYWFAAQSAGRVELRVRGRSVDADEPIELTAGWQEVTLDAVLPKHGTLSLAWQPPEVEEFVAIPAAALRTESVPARVTSPGTKRLASTNRPGDGKALMGVHPSYDLRPMHPPEMELKVSALTRLADGRLILGTFSPLQRSEVALPDIESKDPDQLYELWPIPGKSDDPSAVTRESVADGLYEPSGLCEVDGRLFVAQRKAVTELVDEDGDGYFETHRDVARGWQSWNYHQFTFGLEHRDGKLYTALSTAMAPPGWEGMRHNSAPNDPLRGCVLEIDLSKADDPEGSYRVYAGGLRTPNTIGLGPDGDLFYADNQGTWMPASHLAHVQEGHFYGHFNNPNFVEELEQWLPDGGHASAFAQQPRTPASFLLPHNEFVNSPTQPRLIESGPYAGQMLLGELTAGGIRRLFLEKVNGQWQGAAFRFSQGFEVGVNRMILDKDGSIIIGGIGAAGNWSWRGTQHGVQRLVPNGKQTFEMHSVSAMPNGFEIRFTKPVDPTWLADAANFQATQWRYEPTVRYGGPKLGVQSLEVADARPSEDGRSVAITVPGLKPGHVVRLRTDPTSTDGERIWSTEAYYTLNQIPAADAPRGVGVGAIAPAKSVTLIGRTHAGAMFRRTDEQRHMPRGGAITQDELMEMDPAEGVAVTGQGPLVSAANFGDVRLHVEWFAPPGGEGQQAGNSGVYLQDRYEVQVLGTLAADELGRPVEDDEAGAIYKVAAPAVNASTGPGTWQAYDIWFQAPRFDDDGDKTADARITVYWNGRLIHENLAIPGPTGAAAAGGEQPADGLDYQVGPLYFQDHSSQADGPVRYRNVWVQPIEDDDYTPGEWTPFLSGDGLDGFVIRGGRATFARDGDTVVGRSVPNAGGNTFLVTEDTYDDFELSYEVRSDSLNSGVQIRSVVRGGFDQRDGRVTGPQVEVDPSNRAFSGGIYGEGLGGWIAPLVDNPAARDAWKPGDWNRVDVVAEGPLIRTWINGVPAARTLFDGFRNGHIALQVHGVGADETPHEVRFRKLRLRELRVN